MLTYGLRADEICKLTYRDLETDQVSGLQKLWIRARKGNIGMRIDTDIILIGMAREAIEEWIENCRIKFSPDTPLFVYFRSDGTPGKLNIQQGQFLNDRPLSPKIIEKIIGKYVVSAGIDHGDKRITSRTLRHTALAMLAQAGKSLKCINFIAGHKNVSSTLNYLQSTQA